MITPTNPLFQEGDLIASYSRSQAIEDGVLVDVSEMAREAGFSFPVAVTDALWSGYILPDALSQDKGQDQDGRLWDVLYMLTRAIRAGQREREILYTVVMVMEGRQQKVAIKSVCGPGDEGEPVITLMLPEED